jgi:PhzF family phenazine biosynthesis protein
MKLPIYTVDAFTSVPFKGNPAGVCILEKPIDENLMQKIAFEMNLSETAFLEKESESYNLRWFTPAMEVDLCGHATLASSHILWEEGFADKLKPLHFNTKSGELITEYKKGEIELNFPKLEAKETHCPEELIAALDGNKPKYLGRAKWYYLAELDNMEVVQTLKPDFNMMLKLEPWGIIVTAKSLTTEFDFVSRFFAPERGVTEDPATGSAHCVLGPYWQKRLGKDRFIAYQASERGGVVGVKVGDDNRVYLTGRAITVIKGEITI